LKVSEKPTITEVKEAKGIGALFYVFSMILCLTAGSIGGVYRSCDVSFSGSDDRAICYYRSAVNQPFPYAEDEVVEEVKNAVNLPSKK
jgi:hypothetical protein